MATLTLTIKGGMRNPHVNGRGESLLYWRYVHLELSFLYSTKCRVLPSHINWIVMKSRKTIDRFQPILKNAAAYSIKNKIVKEQGEFLENVIERIKLEKRVPTINLVKERILYSNVTIRPTDFFDFGNQIADELYKGGKIRRAQKYRSVVNKIQTLLGKGKIPITEVSREFLEKYRREAKTKEQNKSSTIIADLKVIRAILIRAVNLKLILEKPAFSRLITEMDSNGKEGLNLTQLKALIGYNPSIDSLEFHIRNIWLFSFYNAGIRIGDLLQLDWTNITANRLNYKMSKTINSSKSHVSLELSEQSIEILKHYQIKRVSNSNSLIFPILHSRVSKIVLEYPINERDGVDPKIIETILKHISARTALINKTLKSISRKLSFGNTILTTHIARHTYTQLALKQGYSLDEISNLLRHSDPKITAGYANGHQR